MAIKQRGKKLSLYMRVPKRYAAVEPRKFIWLSLHTASPSVAEQKAGTAWAQLIEGWEAKLAGDTEDAEQRFAAAQELAAARGFRYLRADKVAELPTEEIIKRIDAISGSENAPDLREAEALLGTAEEPVTSVTDALEMFWNLARDRTLGKNQDQIRRWKNPRKKAIRNFVAVAGNKTLDTVVRNDFLEFRNWLIERMETGQITAGTANKDLIHLADVLKTVNRMKDLGLDLPLGDLSFKEGPSEPRPPFSKAWIGKKLLAPGALDGMNGEARAILLIMINTGCRPSEIAALAPENIRLDSNVPHIAIRALGRQLKSVYAKRDVPLLGVSLEAMRAYPEGFERYRANSASLSATVNKFLRENGLLETPDHTLYSLRHAFEDRMLRAGIDDRIRRDLFGHRLDRERYGEGASLDYARDLLEPVAF